MTASDSSPRLVLLGGAVIRKGGSPLGGPAAHRHRLALLALLAASASPVSRDKLIALLWPERDTESARNLLKVAVHELRKVIGDQAIRTTGDQLSLDPTVISSDVIDLEAAQAAGDLGAAVALYAGPFLDGFFLKDAPEFERWAETQRNRLASRHATNLESLAAGAEQCGDMRAAAEWWKKLSAEDPMRADVSLRLMRALDAAGDRGAAIRHAEAHATLRRRDFDVDPDPAIAALARSLTTQSGQAAGDASATERDAHKTPAHARVVEPSAHRNAEPVITVRPLTRYAIAGALGALVFFALLAVVVGSVVNRRTGQGEAGGSPQIAVVPFDVVAADSSLAYLGHGMVEMLVARIGNDGPMRAVEARSSGAPGRGDQVPFAIQQGRAAGAEQVLVGGVVGGGRGDIDVSAAIYRVSNAEVIGRATRTVPNASSIPAAMDTLVAELMSRAAGEPPDRLADLTRRPLPALRTYLAAQAAYRGGAYVRAESLFARAMGIDSTFALAGLGLALSNSWTSINDHYGIGRDAALRGINDLSARDRTFINAFFGADPALGQPKPAPAYLELWEDAVHKYPDFAEAWYHVGDRYYHFGGLSGLADPLDRARNAFQRALALDSGLVAPLHHLTEIYASLGDADQARATAERYFAKNPGVARDASAIGWTVATVTKDERWLARIRGSFATMPLSDLTRIAWITQANGWATSDADSALAVLDRRASATFEREAAANVRYAFALNAGQISRARAAGVALEGQMPDQPIAALWSAYAALAGDADTLGLQEDLRRLAPFGSAAPSGNPDHRSRQFQARCLVGYAKARNDALLQAREDLAAVRRSAAAEPAGSFQRREGMMCGSWLAAAIAVKAGSADAASLVAQLDTLVLRDRVPPRMSLAAAAVIGARLHDVLGDVNGALAASRWREHYTGDPVFLSAQLRLEGDYALRAGDRPAALRAYRRYLALRPSAEAGPAATATAAVRQQVAELERR